MSEYVDDLNLALAAVRKALMAVLRERDAIGDQISSLNAEFEVLHKRALSLTEMGDRLSSLVGTPDHGLTDLEDAAPAWPGSTVEAVKLILAERPGKVFSVGALLHEFQDRGWVDPDLKTPGPTIYQAARRAAERGDGVRRVGKGYASAPDQGRNPSLSQSAAAGLFGVTLPERRTDAPRQAAG